MDGWNQMELIIRWDGVSTPIRQKSIATNIIHTRTMPNYTGLARVKTENMS